MVRATVPDGRPPPVCWENSHQEKVSGMTAVPPLGAPQPTVALAETAVESWPMIGANQCCTGVRPVTVTLGGTLLSTGCAADALPSLAATMARAVASVSPQVPREQSWATAMAAASAATCSRARAAY